jgi:hypothetical protein
MREENLYQERRSSRVEQSRAGQGKKGRSKAKRIEDGDSSASRKEQINTNWMRFTSMNRWS